MALSAEERKVYAAAYYAANAERLRAYQAAYRRANPANPTKEQARHAGYYAANAERLRAYRVVNAEKIKARGAAYRAANAEKINARHAARVKANPAKRNAKKAKREATKLQATPAWADFGKIGVVYAKAQEWGMEVDHIVPLRSKKVCGLHTWDNLQLLIPLENIGKGNRHWPDMAEHYGD